MKMVVRELMIILFCFAVQCAPYNSCAGDSKDGVLDQEQVIGNANRGVSDTQFVAKSYEPSGNQHTAVSMYA